MWVQRLQRSKIFISFLIALMLVFSYQVSRPKAVAPLVLWGAGVVGSIVLEEAVEMGVKWGVKELGKKKADDIAKTIWNGGKNDLDFPMTKPKKNANGDVIITPSAKDRAKIAGRVADAFDDVIEADLARTKKNSDGYSFVEDRGDTDPMYKTSAGWVWTPFGTDAGSLKAYDMWRKLFDVSIIPVPYEKQVQFTLTSSLTGQKIRITQYNMSETYQDYYDFPGGITYGAYPVNYNPTAMTSRLQLRQGTSSQVALKDHYLPAEIKAMEQYISLLQTMNTKIYMADGFVVPETIKNVYRYPTDRDIPDDYPIPNKTQLSNKPVVIKDLLPDDVSLSGEVEMEWSEVENNYDNDTEISNVINTNNGTYLENGDIVTTTYNTQIVNNYYTDIEQDTKVVDVEEESKTWTPYPPATSDGDDSDLPTGTRPDPVEVLDRSVLDVMVKSYDFFDDAIDATVVSMKSVVDGAGGIVTFLDESMDWLPSEWRAVFVSTFLLGVFAHFFRR